MCFPGSFAHVAGYSCNTWEGCLGDLSGGVREKFSYTGMQIQDQYFMTVFSEIWSILLCITYCYYCSKNIFKIQYSALSFAHL